MKKCLDGTSSLTKRDQSRQEPYRGISLTSSDDGSGSVDFEDKMACIVKCYYDNKMEEEDKADLEKTAAERILLAQLHTIYKELGFANKETLRPDLVHTVSVFCFLTRVVIV